jgi:outer membrane lipoprotein-sorting protein
MKNFSSYILVLLLISIGISPLLAQPKGFKALRDTASFKKNFNEKSQKIMTNEADFIQEKYLSVMTEKAISKGKFYYMKPNKMRWETTEPTIHIIVLDNGKMMIKEKGKIKTYDTNSNRMFKGLNDMMLTTASGNMLNSKDYTYSLFENDKYFLAELHPTQTTSKKFVKTIEILVEKMDYTVAQIKMNEPSGDYTRIEFSNKKLNTAISGDKFSLK